MCAHDIQDDFDMDALMQEDGPLIDGDNLFIYPNTMFGTAYVYDVELEDGTPVRLLEVGGAFESATFLGKRRFETSFAYYKSFDFLFKVFPQPERVLLIGGGGYAYPKHFIASQPHGIMDVVEIDPAITRIARNHFYLDELIEKLRTEETGRLNLFTADGLEFLHTTSNSYNAIINDSFSGDVPTEALMSHEALQLIKSKLVPGGLLMLNVICDAEVDPAPLNEVREVLQQEFEHVYSHPCIDEVFGDNDNNLVVATDANLDFIHTTFKH